MTSICRMKPCDLYICRREEEPFKLKIIQLSVQHCLENKAICSNSLQMEIYHLVENITTFSKTLDLVITIPVSIACLHKTRKNIPVGIFSHKFLLALRNLNFQMQPFFLRKKIRVLLNIFNKPNLILYLYSFVKD